MKKYIGSKYLFAVIVIFFVGLLIFKKGFNGQIFKTESGQRIGSVKRQDVIRRVTVAGNIFPNKKTVISAPYNGYIKKIFVTVGEHVKVNDPVVSIVQSLHSAADDSYPMRAPFSGVVTQVLKTEGEYVEQGKDLNSSIVRIDDPSRLFISADVAEADVDRIKVGQECQVKVAASPNRTYKGVIREISEAAKDKASTRPGEHVDFNIKIEVVERDENIKPGMSALVDIVTDKRTNILALRQEFVDKKGDNYFVTLEDGTHRDVKVGLQNEEVFEILNGLKEGDKVRMIDLMAFSNDDTSN